VTFVVFVVFVTFVAVGAGLEFMALPLSRCRRRKAHRGR
jgi:hypothetical protein